MKLDHDLIRDVLLFVESHCISNTDTDGTETFVNNPIYWRTVFEDERLDCRYDIDDIKYCLVVLYEAGFIEAKVWHVRGGYHDMLIRDLTWQGRTFIENITSDTVWNRTKQAVGSIGRVSMEAMSQVAGAIAAQLILRQL